MSSFLPPPPGEDSVFPRVEHSNDLVRGFALIVNVLGLLLSFFKVVFKAESLVDFFLTTYVILGCAVGVLLEYGAMTADLLRVIPWIDRDLKILMKQNGRSFLYFLLSTFCLAGSDWIGKWVCGLGLAVACLGTGLIRKNQQQIIHTQLLPQ